MTYLFRVEGRDSSPDRSTRGTVRRNDGAAKSSQDADPVLCVYPTRIPELNGSENFNKYVDLWRGGRDSNPRIPTISPEIVRVSRADPVLKASRAPETRARYSCGSTV